MSERMSDAEFRERSSEDFKFLVLCQMKGNMGFYHAFKDAELVEEAKLRAAEAKAAEAPLYY